MRVAWREYEQSGLDANECKFPFGPCPRCLAGRHARARNFDEHGFYSAVYSGATNNSGGCGAQGGIADALMLLVTLQSFQKLGPATANPRSNARD